MATDRKAYYKAYREANKEKVTAQQKSWYEANKDKAKARVKAYRQADKKRAKAQQKVYREANKETLKAWKKNNRGTVNAINKRYKESKRNNNYIVTELDRFVEQEMYELAQIRTKQLGKEWHVDHTIPLSKGGPHAIHNLEVVPKAWNLSKGNRNSNRFNKHLTQVEV